jgi:predicted TIM-barrel fold metal-dependent hydrolase
VIVDSHAHLEPRVLDVDALIVKMDAAGIDRVALIPPANDPLPVLPERLLALARRLSRSRAGRLLVEGVHRTTLTSDGQVRVSGLEVRIVRLPDNASVAALCARKPDRFRGWIFLNPKDDPKVLDELERWRGEPGMIGIKMHPHWHDYLSELCVPVVRRAAELGLPVLVHLGFRQRGDYRALAEKVPSARIVAAHAGFPHYDDLWRAAKDLPNLRIDLSSPYLDEPLVRAAVAAIGPERCLYGTDAPYGFHQPDGTYDYGAIRGWVERLPVSARLRERILGDNFGEITEG